MSNNDAEIIRGSLTGAYQEGWKDRMNGLAEPREPLGWLYMNGWSNAGRHADG